MLGANSLLVNKKFRADAINSSPHITYFFFLNSTNTIPPKITTASAINTYVRASA